MKRSTTDSMNRGTDTSDLTAGNACWETPPLVFEKLNADFGPFDIDLTADVQRHLCPIWFGPESPVNVFDALKTEWDLFGNSGYSNPPYGPFVQRILAQAKVTAIVTGFTSTLLLPMRVTKAFKECVLDGAMELLFCDSRLTFFENGAPRLNERKWMDEQKAIPDPAMFDSIIVRYGTSSRLNVGIWNVPKHVMVDDLDRAVERRKRTTSQPVELMASLKKALDRLPLEGQE